jgi:LuxR family maltose regulon positive regulatory protein
MAEGDLGRARHHAERTLEHAEADHLTAYHQIAVAHSVLGVTLLAEDRTAARRHVDHGVELARRSNRPIMLAYALASRAQVTAADQPQDAAMIDLTEARKLLAPCPDPGMVLTFVARREAQLGGSDIVPPHISQADMVERLTPRELTVLRLLPSRLNVTEIADELYVSPNTVKGHVKAIYRKLGVNERAVAIQRARELRLL